MIGRLHACCAAARHGAEKSRKTPARLLVMAESVKVLVATGGHGVQNPDATLTALLGIAFDMIGKHEPSRPTDRHGGGSRVPGP